MSKLKPGEIVHQKIMEHAGTPEGFRPMMAGAYSKNATVLCKKLLSQGVLRVEKVSAIEVHYFFAGAVSHKELQKRILEKRKPAVQDLGIKKRGPNIKDAPVEYRAGYKFTSYPTPPPRNQVVLLPGIHGGTGAMR